MMFDKQIARKPDRYPQFRQYIMAVRRTPWHDEQFSFQSDIQDWKTEMDDTARSIVTRTLSGIGQVECRVKSWWANLGRTLPHPTFIDLGYTFASLEAIHSDGYERLLTVLQLEHVFEENLKLPVIKGRDAYLAKYSERHYANDLQQFAYSTILFTLFTEYVSLFSQFYIILWYKRHRTWLRDTSQMTLYTRAEETTHAFAGIDIVNQMRKEHPEVFDADLAARVMGESQVAFTHESRLIDWMLGDFAAEGLSAPLLKEYVKGRINDALVYIGYPRAFTNLDQSLLDQTLWMDEGLKGDNMADFFHRRPTEYSENHASFDEDSLFGDSALAFA